MAEETPNVEELKAQEQKQVEIVIEEEDVAEEKKAKADVSEALGDLGRQFAETIQAAWNSQERREFESEVREGVQHFATEAQKVFQEARESQAALKVKEEAEEVRTRVETGDIGRKTRSTIVEGLQWLSQELARLAEQFSPPEKQPEATEETVEEELS